MYLEMTPAGVDPDDEYQDWSESFDEMDADDWEEHYEPYENDKDRYGNKGHEEECHTGSGIADNVESYDDEKLYSGKNYTDGYAKVEFDWSRVEGNSHEGGGLNLQEDQTHFKGQGYGGDGYDKGGYDREGFDKDGYNHGGYDRQVYNLGGFNRAGFDRRGFHKNGGKHDDQGFDSLGFNKEGLHRNGTKIDSGGYFKGGFNKAGVHKNGTKYNDQGFDKDGVHKNGEQFNDQGYDGAGFNRDGYDREGIGWNGFRRDGYDRNGYGIDGYDRNGYNREFYDKDGFHTSGYHRNGMHRDGAPQYDPHASRKYWVWIEGESHGPATILEFWDALLEGNINRNDYVWTEGLEDWVRISDSELKIFWQGKKKPAAKAVATRSNVGKSRNPIDDLRQIVDRNFHSSGKVEGYKRYHIRSYIPVRTGMQDNHSKAIISLKNRQDQAVKYFLNILGVLKDCKFTICTVPGSDPGEHSGTVELAEALARSPNITHASTILVKKYETLPLSQGGDRDPDTIQSSLRLNDNSGLIRNKTVLLLDDVATSWSTMTACIRHLKKANPALIVPLVLGLTPQ
jgi:hypothetical protein